MNKSISIAGAKGALGKLVIKTLQRMRTASTAVLSKFGSVHALFHLVGGKTFADTLSDDWELMRNQHVRAPTPALPPSCGFGGGVRENSGMVL